MSKTVWQLREEAKSPDTSPARLLDLAGQYPYEVLENPVLDLLEMEDPRHAFIRAKAERVIAAKLRLSPGSFSTSHKCRAFVIACLEHAAVRVDEALPPPDPRVSEILRLGRKVLDLQRRRYGLIMSGKTSQYEKLGEELERQTEKLDQRTGAIHPGDGAPASARTELQLGCWFLDRALTSPMWTESAEAVTSYARSAVAALAGPLGSLAHHREYTRQFYVQDEIRKEIERKRSLR